MDIIKGMLGLVFIVSTGVSQASSLYVDPLGNVGVGTDSPIYQMDIIGSDPLTATENTTALYLTNSSTTVGGRVMLGLSNNGTARFSIENTSVPDARWVFAVGNSTSFRISKADTPVVEFEVTASGDVNAQGTFNTLSDRNSKMNIETLNSIDILGKVVSLPLSSWSYKGEPGVSHVGPMAQDFYSAFSLGKSDKSISGTDAAGIALVAIQGLYKQLEEKELRIQALEARIESQELMMTRIQALEDVAVRLMLLQEAPELKTTVLNQIQN